MAPLEWGEGVLTRHYWITSAPSTSKQMWPREGGMNMSMCSIIIFKKFKSKKNVISWFCHILVIWNAFLSFLLIQLADQIRSPFFFLNFFVRLVVILLACSIRAWMNAYSISATKLETCPSLIRRKQIIEATSAHQRYEDRRKRKLGKTFLYHWPGIQVFPTVY